MQTIDDPFIGIFKMNGAHIMSASLVLCTVFSFKWIGVGWINITLCLFL